MEHTKRLVIGIYDDEEEVLQACSEVRQKGLKIQEVYTPFPVHGLDKAIGHERTRIPVAAFIFGCCGFSFAIFLTFWTMGVDWPMLIGGKDFLAIPDFVPVTFELTVLFTAFGMVFTFFLSNNLWWGTKENSLDLRSTDDKFVMAIDLNKNHKNEAEISEILKNSGAIEVTVKER